MQSPLCQIVHEFNTRGLRALLQRQSVSDYPNNVDGFSVLHLQVNMMIFIGSEKNPAPADMDRLTR